MTDHAKRARADLERLAPEVWIEVYAAPILDDLDAATSLVMKQGQQLQKSTDAIKGLLWASQALSMMSNAVMAFERATGWREGDTRKLKLTPARWAASMGLAKVCRKASRAGMEAVKPFIQDVARTATEESPTAALDRLLETLKGSDANSEGLAKLEATIVKLREVVARKCPAND